MIEIKNLTKEYKDENNVVLDNINLNITDFEIFGIVGMSGAGKTTLLKILTGLVKPSKGEVLIDNKNLFLLKEKEKREFRKNFGVCFQGYNLLLQETIYNNIALPLVVNKYNKEEIKIRVSELLNLVGLENKEKMYPSKLSGGMQQRVAIARAIATKPKYLLLDEPTSALDPYTTNQILKLLKEINEKFKITIIIITHEMKVIKKICSSVAVLKDGKIIESGTVKEIVNNPKTEFSKILFEEEEIK